MDVLDELLDGIDTTGIDTSNPVLRAGLYKVTVSDIKAEPLKNRPDEGSQILMKLQLEQAAKDTEGRDVSPGFGLFWRGTIFKSPSSEGETKANDITKINLAKFQEAIGVAKGPFIKNDYIGKSLTVNAKVTEYQGVSRNEVAQFVKTKTS